MIIQKRFKILLAILGVTILCNVIIWLIILNALGSQTAQPTEDLVVANSNMNQASNEVLCNGVDCDSREKQMETIKNDLLFTFKNELSSGNGKQVVCRNGKVGLEQIGMGYVWSETLSADVVEQFKAEFGQTPFYFSRPVKDVANSVDQFNEFIYYGKDGGQITVKNVSDFKGDASTIDQEQFINHYSAVADTLSALLVDDNKLSNLVDTALFFLDKEHDFRVVEWLFQNFELKNGTPTYAPNVFYVTIPSELKDQVQNLYNKVDTKILFVVTDYGVFKTFPGINNTQINYTELPQWDENYFGFIPTDVQGINRYELSNPSAELLEAVKNKQIDDDMYYFANPISGKTEIYSVRANASYSSLKELGDFCN